MLQKAARQYKYYLISAASKNTKLGRILIFRQGRTGSTLLTDLLSKHDDVFCHEEIFGNHHLGPFLFPSRLADGMAESVEGRVYGFHVKPGQLRDNTVIGDLSKWLHEMEQQGWYIVHLCRKNLLKHAVSTIKASRTNVYPGQSHQAC